MSYEEGVVSRMRNGNPRYPQEPQEPQRDGSDVPFGMPSEVLPSGHERRRGRSSEEGMP